MDIHAKVKMFLEALRSQDTTEEEGLSPNDCAHHIVREVFSKGNCGNLAVMLSVAFNGTPVILTSRDHIVTDIHGVWYDINGDVTTHYKGVKVVYTTVKHVMTASDMYNNYSFAERGPII